MATGVGQEPLKVPSLVDWALSWFVEEHPFKQWKEAFNAKWERSSFVEKLVLVLHFREELSIADCENMEVLNFLTPLLSEPEFDLVFYDLQIDCTTLILAMHDRAQPHSEQIRGRFRDYLESYLSYLVTVTRELLVNKETSPSERVLLLLRVLETKRRNEDPETLTPSKAFEQCYEALPEEAKEAWRADYRRSGAKCNDSQLDFGITHSKIDFIYIAFILPMLSRESSEMDLSMVKILKEAQESNQREKALLVLAWICSYRQPLYTAMVGHEQARHNFLNLLGSPPSLAGFTHIKKDPLSAIAVYGVKATYDNLIAE